MSFFKKLLGGGGRTLDEFATRTGISAETLRTFAPHYRSFEIPKRGGGTRRIDAPDDATKALQKTLLLRAFQKLHAHPCVTGFEKNYSIVSNALPHVGKAVVVCMDIENFFPSTSADRVQKYFRHIGWDKETAAVILKLCTLNGGLPQGAPTSPRLSNIVNYLLDARITAVADSMEIAYTRYADDLTFSFAVENRDTVHNMIRATKEILDEFGYKLHQQKKLRIRRAHQQQKVTGLVVNKTPNLPRKTRRHLRAIEHHIKTGKESTMTEAQLKGWQALGKMVENQRQAG